MQLAQSFRSALKTGWQAALKNRIPGLFLWLTGMAFIVGYYGVPPVKESLERVGQFKLACGWQFSLFSTALFGGLIPSLVTLCLTRKPNEQNEAVQQNAKGIHIPSQGEILVANTILWGLKGVEIDLFYQFQGWLFGTAADWQTVTIKTICDQFLMVPVLGMVNVVLFYHWQANGYSIRKAWMTLGRDWYGRLVLPPLIANWFIWVPAVAMIYCLPSALQLPVQNLILCFWVLILAVFTQSKSS